MSVCVLNKEDTSFFAEGTYLITGYFILSSNVYNILHIAFLRQI